MWLPILAGLGSSLIGGIGASKAAGAQSRAADGQLQLGREQLAASDQRYKQQLGLSREVSKRQREIARGTLNNQARLARETAGQLRGNAQDYRRDMLGESNRAYDNASRTADTYQRQMGDTAQGYRDNALAAAGSSRDAQVAAYQPYADSGGAANSAMAYELGLADRPDSYRGYEASPGYQFALGEGIDAIEGSAAARGGLLSGRAVRSATGYATGMAQQDYGNHLGRLAGQGAQGLAAASGIAGAQAGYGNAAQNVEGNFADMQSATSGNFANMMNNANAAKTGIRTSGLNNWSGMLNAAAAGSGAARADAWGNFGANQGNAWGTLASLGANAGSQAAGSSANAYNFMGNALANRGDAGAAGAAGWANALTGGIETGLGMYQMNKMLQTPMFGGQQP